MISALGMGAECEVWGRGRWDHGAPDGCRLWRKVAPRSELEAR